MTKKEILQKRAVRFLALFGGVIIIMTLIRMMQTGNFNPLKDEIAILGLCLGLVSYWLSVILERKMNGVK